MEFHNSCVYSPYNSQSNGLAEIGVKIIKRIIKKKIDEGKKDEILTSLLEFRNTPIPTRRYSPAQLFMHRVLKSRAPTTSVILEPKVIDPSLVQNNIKRSRDLQKSYYDRNTRNLKPLSIDDKVTIREGKHWGPGKVVGHFNNRSYLVQNSKGNVLRRNRKFLNKTNAIFSDCFNHYPPKSNDHTHYPINTDPNVDTSVLSHYDDFSFRGFTDSDAQNLSFRDNSINCNNGTRELSPSVVRTRSGRQVSQPKYLEDYEL